MLSEMFYKLWNNGLIQLGVWETIYMTLISSAIAYVIGLPLGVILSVTDANGSTTSYTYNGQTELLATSTNAAGRQTTYEYFLSSGRAKSTYQSGVAAIGYTYSGGRLSQLDRKTYRSGTAQHQYYNFAYNVWGQTTTTKVGSRTLSTNTYYNYVNDDTARGGNLKSTAYANGDSVSYTYGQPVRQGTD